MPDYAPSATPRYVASYFAARHQHTLTVRGHRGSSQAAVESLGQNIAFTIFNEMSAVLADDFTWVSALYIPQDTEVSVISSVPPDVTGAVAVSGFSKQDSITTLGLAGKGSGGSKLRWQIYGFNWTLDVTSPNGQEDFVLLTSENASLDSLITELNSIGPIAIDDSIATMYNRATIKTNDHWLKLLRRGFA